MRGGVLGRGGTSGSIWGVPCVVLMCSLCGTSAVRGVVSLGVGRLQRCTGGVGSFLCLLTPPSAARVVVCHFGAGTGEFGYMLTAYTDRLT